MMPRDPFERVRRANPVDPRELPAPPPGLADRAMRARPAAHYRLRGPAIAVVSMAVIMLAGGVTTLVMLGEPENGVVTQQTSTTTSQPTTRPDPPVPATVDVPPWSATPLPKASVPQHLIDDWTASENHTWCSVLYPADTTLLAGATSRSADFSGDWGVAWDLPAGPGRRADGGYCPNCGRGAFGVAGVRMAGTRQSVEIWPNRLDWEDGSVGGYGFEGLESPRANEPSPPLLAYLVVEGQGCLYNVWSFLGEQHLLGFLGSLHFVDGLQAEPIRVVDRTAPEPRDAGAAPWDQPSIVSTEIPAVFWLEWNEDLRTETCPMMAFNDLGPEGGGAVSRRGNGETALIVAWDLPGGPGRYGSGDYCADCGRGAFGISLWRQDGFFTERGNPTLRYNDGSEVWIAPELNPELPDDRIVHLDPETGRPAPEAYRARIQVADHPDCLYQVWSSYGSDHVETLVNELRFVGD